MAVKTEVIIGLNPDGIQPSRDAKPSLLAAVGVLNMIRIALKKAPRYDEQTLNTIAGRGSSPVTISNRRGEHAETVGFYSWQTVYEAFRRAGLLPAQAQEETSKRVLTLD